MLGRLRHLKSVVIRNLSLPVSQELASTSLNISVYFTIHSLYNEDKSKCPAKQVARNVASV